MTHHHEHRPITNGTFKTLADEPKWFNTDIHTIAGNEFTVLVTSDGTTTVASIHLDVPGPYGGKDTRQVAEGIARRRRGEARDDKLGHTLALARAFADAAEAYAATADRILAPQAYDRVIDADTLDGTRMRQLSAKMAQRQSSDARRRLKDMKRGEARRQYEAKHNGPYGSATWRP